jgi:hypothetical protein
LGFRWLGFLEEERVEQEKHLEEGQRGGLVKGQEGLVRVVRGGGKDPLEDMANQGKVCFLCCTVKLAPDVATAGSRGRCWSQRSCGSHCSGVVAGKAAVMRAVLVLVRRVGWQVVMCDCK